jgi:alginate O-acetyltransferase complex protein AlgI
MLMLFASAVFLFLFLPLVLLTHYLSPKRFKNTVLLFASLAFYTWGEQKMVFLILLSATVDFFAGRLIEKNFRKQGLFLSLFFNVAILAYFKYASFFFENLFWFSECIGISAQYLKVPAEASLPLGISFFTFQTMSYTIDVYRGKTVASRNFVNFATYVTLFPQLVAGPIVRYHDVQKELKSRVVSLTDFSEGIRRFIIGLGKKMLLANNLAFVADGAFNLPQDQLSTFFAWAGLFAYAFQIYFDFSGYSDMAIGLGKMFGFRFPENFNNPYLSTSIREFWRRWHITLSSWFKDYVYIPLGGNRMRSWRTYLNLFLVFFLTGLWHGASWNFIFWGLWHGLFLILERATNGHHFFKAGFKVFGHFYALSVVFLGWVFFRANDLEHGLSYLKSMFWQNSVILDGSFVSYYMRTESIFAFFFALFCCLPEANFLKIRKASLSQKWPLPVQFVERLFLLLIFLISCMYVAVDAYNPFIYFRF